MKLRIVGQADEQTACCYEPNPSTPQEGRSFGTSLVLGTGRLVLVSLAVFVAFGCGGIPDDQAIVTGQVLMPDGSPYTLGNTAIGFEPTDSENLGTPAGLGMLGDQGRYEILASETNYGLLHGDYKVVLYVEGEEAELALAKVSDWGETAVPPYMSHETTPWEAKVTKAGENHFVFKITGKAEAETEAEEGVGEADADEVGEEVGEAAADREGEEDEKEDPA